MASIWIKIPKNKPYTDNAVAPPQVYEGGELYEFDDQVVAERAAAQRIIDARGGYDISNLVNQTGPLLISDGSVAAPAIAPGSDTDTGILFPGVGQMAIAVAGALALSFTASAVTFETQLLANYGSASLPGIAFDGDSNTGLHRPANGAIQVINNGAVGAHIEGAAAGFGTNDPKGRVHIAAVSGHLYLEETDATADVGLWTLAVNGERFQLQSRTDAGSFVANVFQVTRAGQLWAVQGSAAAPAYSYGSDTDTGSFSPGANQWAVATGGTLALSVDAGQNVAFEANVQIATAHGLGIGTAPAANHSLHIQRGDNNVIAKFERAGANESCAWFSSGGNSMFLTLKGLGVGKEVEFRGTSAGLMEMHTGGALAVSVDTSQNMTLEGDLTGKGKIINTPVELTISAGAVTATCSAHALGGEGNAADTLTTINGGVDGMILVLTGTGTGAEAITVSSSGNLNLNGGGSRTLADAADTLTLQYRTAAGGWIELAYSNNGGLS